MDHHVTAVLVPGRHALPRLVARLHALGVEVVALQVSGDRVTGTLRAATPAGRLQAALARVVDVRHVEVQEVRPVTTTYVVLRQDVAA